MTDLPDNLTPTQLQAVIADGELNARAQPESFALALAQPDSAEQLLQHTSLRKAVARVMSEEPTPSADLHQRLEALADQWLDEGTVSLALPDAQAANRQQARWHRWSRPLLAVAAAAGFIAVGLMLGRYLAEGSNGSGRVAVTPTPPIVNQADRVPISLANFVTRTHVGCSRSQTNHGTTMPASIADLDAPIHQYLGGETTEPDLSSIGYTYVGCGPCGRPHEKLVHFLYQKLSPVGTDTLSLFVEPYTGQVSCEPGHSYSVGGSERAHPMLVWRTSDLVFMLVGNAAEPVEKARVAIKAPDRV